MNNIQRAMLIALAVLAPLALLAACERGSQDAGTAHAEGDGHDRGEEQATSDPNVVGIPAAVRSNLGISFIKVERRRIE